MLGDSRTVLYTIFTATE